MTTLTYLQFHLVFLGGPLLVLAAATARGVALAIPGVPAVTATPRVRLAGHSLDARVVGVVIMAALAFAYTTPWDSYLIRRGAWRYGEGAVAARFLAVPLGEYLFFVLQPVLTALWLYLLPAWPPERPARMDGGTALRCDRPVPTPGERALGAGGGGLVALGGWLALALDGGLYLGTLLLWAAPVLAIQWAFGWPYLWARRRVVALAVAVPSLYLWVADRVALVLGVWELSPDLTTGYAVPLLGLPVEEAAFFLLTNLFVVQGLVLWFWVVDRWL
ncbi:lycopene cyclase domain-containing protein [Haloglomus halophilum]|uniref:lycopene cyclase domain-containing protein n=1 Tax=Haloglomus halophilum TaxID=2962672 RepID=UPI0020C9FBF6|nr:lycopene cyclase domain-containing protein [Haloglomus halophilum]